MRNSEATRERILEAALAEFSAYGIAGARVDRIARQAGCNKNLIYIYFENKETLFSTILQKHLARVYEEVTFTPDELPAYAARLFDFAMAHPDLMRLMTWFGLEREGLDISAKPPSLDGKVAAVMKAQKAGRVATAVPPRFLVNAITALATAWTAANPFVRWIDPDAHKRPAALRRSVAEAVRLLSQSGIGAVESRRSLRREQSGLRRHHSQ
jgi:AcrR family transcriptional regulator